MGTYVLGCIEGEEGENEVEFYWGWIYWDMYCNILEKWNRMGLRIYWGIFTGAYTAIYWSGAGGILGGILGYVLQYTGEVE